jgi:hypothetical protein
MKKYIEVKVLLLVIARLVVDISHVCWHKQIWSEALSSLDFCLSFLDF